MKFNIKIGIALALIIIISIWTVNQIRTRNYADDQLTFDIGSGVVTITNPSDEPVAAEVRGTSFRTFTMSSDTDSLSGRSTRESSGQSTIQIFAFELPSGTNEFSLSNATDAVFTTESSTRLTAAVQPVSAGTARNFIIALLVAVAGLVYYISSTMNHSWIAMLRGETPIPVAAPSKAQSEAAAHGTPTRSFGDNISRKAD